MKNPRHKILFVTGVLFFLGLFVCAYVAVSSGTLSLAGLGNHSQLSQIVAIETELLKNWQQAGALTQNLTFASEGSGVKLLQRMLSQDPLIYPEQEVTGYYGERTFAAVQNFQREYGLPVTGVVDSVTREKLNEIFLSHLCPEETENHPEFLMHQINEDDPLPLEYVPPNLVDVSTQVPTIGVVCVRRDVVRYLVSMFEDAREDGVELMVTSGYRKAEIQKYLYDFWVSIEGDEVVNEIAEPGFSEHQLGTAVDLTDASIGYAGVDDRFAKSNGGVWLRKNAHKYGFTMSYQRRKEEETGFSYEPWHWRYVGEKMAEELREDKITFNEAKIRD